MTSHLATPSSLGPSPGAPVDEARRRLSLRSKIVLYLLAIHAILGAVAVVALVERPLWLFAAEAAFALSAWLGVRLIKAFFVPLALIRTGAELIGEQDFSSTFLPVGQPEMDALIAVHNRMLTRLREERLRVQEQDALLARLLEASPAGVLTLDFDGRVLLANPAALALLGEDPRGRMLPDLSPLGPALDALADDDSAVVALGGGRRLKIAGGSFFDRGFARRFFVLEELTEELRASERAAYGKLIRMMSHEINNSGGAVGSLLDSLRTYAPALGGGDQKEFLDAITIAIQRLERLRVFTNGFADVVRLPDPEPRPCDLGELVRELLVLWSPQLEARGIAVAVAIDPSLPPVLLDRNQIEQVLVNLLKNAQEAIGEASPRREIHLSLQREEGRQVLRLRDTGPGIEPSARAALFTPFFSTKQDGRGLGLTLVREILARHGFEFGLDNSAEGGAEFWIRF